MDEDVLLFFDKMPDALPLYEELERRLAAGTGEMRRKVQKTQISFYNRRIRLSKNLLVCRGRVPYSRLRLLLLKRTKSAHGETKRFP